MNPVSTLSSIDAVSAIPSTLWNLCPLWMMASSAPIRPKYTCACSNAAKLCSRVNARRSVALRLTTV